MLADEASKPDTYKLRDENTRSVKNPHPVNGKMVNLRYSKSWGSERIPQLQLMAFIDSAQVQNLPG